VQHRLTVNGTSFEVEIGVAETLLELLRDRLGLTGTKQSCGRGECGACTVLIDGTPRMSCIELAARVDEVWTIEGLADESAAFRAAMAQHGGFQCGFCTPGQVVTATALMREGIPEDEDGLRRAISGNVCRCTGYDGIVDSYCAVRAADADARADGR